MAYEAEYVKYEKTGHVANIHMNRPERLNAFGSAMGDQLGGAWMEVIAEDDVRSVVLSGEGRLFCAARDIRSQAHRARSPRAGPGS